MSLIICPECGAKISDMAVACPHCGFPLAESDQTTSARNEFCIIVKNYHPSKSLIFDIANEISKKTPVSHNEAYCCFFTDNNCDTFKPVPFVVFSSESKDAINIIASVFINNGVRDISVEEVNSNTSEISIIDKARELKRQNVPTCPVCGSTSITTGQRGYSLLTGFLGSSKTVNRCANCGHTWTPGKR